MLFISSLIQPRARLCSSKGNCSRDHRRLALSLVPVCICLMLMLTAPVRAWSVSVITEPCDFVDGFVDGVWNPEDLVRLPGTPWVVVSAMRSRTEKGALLLVDVRNPVRAMPFYPAAYPTGHSTVNDIERTNKVGSYAPSIVGAPDPEVFFPHGLGVRDLGDGRFELLVVDHGDGESVAIFELDTGTEEFEALPVIASVSRIPLPRGGWANGVVALPKGGFVITSMFDPEDDHFVEKFAAAEKTGGLWRWLPRSGWQAFGDPQLSGGNGIALSPDGSVLFVSEWAARRFWRVPLNGGKSSSVVMNFLPDNIRWMSDGRLLVAGQSSAPEQVFACEEQGRSCPMGFRVVAIAPDTLDIFPLLDVDEVSAAASGFGGATGALQVGTDLWVGSFTGNRIGKINLCSGQNCPGTQDQERVCDSEF